MKVGMVLEEPPDHQVLLHTVPLGRRQQLRVHEVHPHLVDGEAEGGEHLADPRAGGDQAEVASARHTVMAGEGERRKAGSWRVVPGVVRVDEVDELVVPLVAAAVHAGHDLPPCPAGGGGGAARAGGTWRWGGGAPGGQVRAPPP